jgi:Lrp/AsnC family transcriptional regulator, leucine-responsive regulatory protein
MQIRSGKLATPNPVDATDARIMDILRTNGRATNQDIADRLQISPATVSARLRRLEETKAMRVVAVSDFSAHGLKILIAVGVKVEGRSAEDVGRDLAKLPEVLSINVMNGRADLELLVGLHDFEEITTFLIDHVSGIEGVAELYSGIAVDIVKFEFNTAPL